MNSNEQFLDNYDKNIEPITVQAEVEESSDEAGVGTLAAGVAGAAVGAVIGGTIAGKQGAVIGAVAGAVAGGLAAKATPDDAGERIKDAAENVAEKIKDTAEHVKPSIEGAADKVKHAAFNAADKVQDVAEHAKPSNHQDTRIIEPKERIVIEPTSYNSPDATLTYTTDNFPEVEVTPVEVYGETPDSEIEQQYGFMRDTEQRL